MNGIQLIDTFQYSGKKFLDIRKHCADLAELLATDETSVPDGFCKYVESVDAWYQYLSSNDLDDSTGRWRKKYEHREILNDEFAYAIVDASNNVLFGLKWNGESFIPKGMPEEVKTRFSELSAIQPTVGLEYMFAIVDSLGNLLFGIDRAGKIVVQRGITVDGHSAGIDLMESENWLFAIMDNAGHLLFGIRHDGSVEFTKGIPKQIQERFDELKGYQYMTNEEYIFAILDSRERLLFGIRRDGTVQVTKGIVEVVTAEEYDAMNSHDNHTLYAISDKGRIVGAYIGDKVLNTGEIYSYLVEANAIIYRGAQTKLPKIWIDYDYMTVNVDYPSDYEGPMFVVDDDVLFII